MNLTVTKSTLDENDVMRMFRAFYRGGQTNDKRLIRMNGESHRFTMTATNGKTFLTVNDLPMYEANTVNIIVSWDDLRRIMKGNGHKTITFENPQDVPIRARIDDGTKTHLARVTNINKDEWPEEPGPPKTFHYLRADFLPKLRKAMPFTEIDGMREPLKGVLIDKTCLVATDGKRLIRLPVTHDIPEQVVVKRNWFLMSNLMTGAAELGIIEGEDGFGHVLIKVGPWSYVTPQPQVQYPNYRQVLPDAKSLKKSINFNADGIDELVDKIKVSAVDLKKRVDPVHLLFEKDGVKAVHDDGEKECVIDLKAESKGVDDEIVSINRSILLEALENGFNTIHFQGKHGTMMATGEEIEGDLILMPMNNVGVERVRGVVKDWRSGRKTPHEPAKEDESKETQTHTERSGQMNNGDNQNQETKKSTTTGFKIIGEGKDKDVETFEDLIEYATEVKQTMTHLKEMVNALPTKVRNVQRDVKAKEKEFENARNAIKQLQKVSGF